MDPGSQAATASVRSLSSSGVHGTNLGGVMVGSSGEDEREDEGVGWERGVRGIDYDTGQF